MKSIYLFLLVLIFTGTELLAQDFQNYNYQAIARESGEVISNQNVSLRFTFHENSALGTIIFQESQTTTTNEFGMLNLVIGQGTVLMGDINDLGSGNDNYFLRVELDTGSGFVDMGANQISSVPFATRALNVENDQDNQTLFISGNQLSIDGGNTITIPSTGGGTDNQTMNFNSSNSQLSISGGNTVDLSTLDQDLSISGSQLVISGGTNVNLNDLDDQTLSISGNQLSIDNGNTITLPSSGGGSDDQTISLSGNTLTIEDGNSVNLSTIDNQTLSVLGNQLTINNGNTVSLPSSSLWDENGTNINYTVGNVGIGTDEPEFDMHVDGEFFVNSLAGRINFGAPGDGNRWRMSTQGSGSNLQFQSKPSGSNTFTRRLFFAQDGNIAIGNNSNPDEELVIGTNLGSGWVIPAVTVGGTSGGAFQAGNSDYKISFSSSSTFNRARIISSSPNGFGTGEIEMRTNGLSLGENPGAPGAYMLRMEHSSFGLLLERFNTSNDWELLTSSGAAGNLNLYDNGILAGVFSGTDGSYNTSSDRRLKKNIQPVESMLNKVLKLNPSTYYYKRDPNQKIPSIGFIAQEAKELFPELVMVSEDERSKGMHAVNYGGFSVVAIKAIQEQQEIISDQQKQINELKELIDNLAIQVQKH